jgi:NADPH:quinone reductase-like Zn-dependent oxidoreductase
VLVVRYEAHGGPEVLCPVQVPDADPGPGEVLVRIHAAAVNSVDAQLRAGRVPGRGVPPFVPGLDVSGVVERTGPEVTTYVEGDEVVGYLSPAQGGYATHVSAPVEAFVPAPVAIGRAQAAALPLVGLTALQALEAAGVESGHRVLVHAAAGGVGHMAVQLAAARGAHVVATARESNHEFLAKLGASELIDHTRTDFADVASDVDVVLDLVGGDYAARSLDTLRPGGVVLGLTLSPGDVEQEAQQRGLRYAFFGLHASPDDLRTLVDEVDAGRLVPQVQQVLPLVDAAEAHRLLEARRIRGKVVLAPGA